MLRKVEYIAPVLAILAVGQAVAQEPPQALAGEARPEPASGLPPLQGGAPGGPPVSAAAAPVQPIMPLKSFWSDSRADYWMTGTVAGERAAVDAFKYKPVSIEGAIYSAQHSGTAPLQLYWNEQLTDNLNIASEQSKAEALAKGYKLAAVEGYVDTVRRPGTVPLKLYWNAARQDSLTLATDASEKAALRDGYRFVRVEGYVFPPGTTRVPARR